MKYVGYYNGEIGPLEEMKIPMLDRAVYFGDGCYDATTFANNNIFAADDHLDRFYNSCKLLEIPFEMSREELRAELQKCIDANEIDHGMLYWQCSRGTTYRGHQFPPATVKPNLMIFTVPCDLIPFDKTFRLISMEDTRFLHCNIKTLNLIPSVIAYQRCIEQGCQETVFHRGERGHGLQQRRFRVLGKLPVSLHRGDEEFRLSPESRFQIGFFIKRHGVSPLRKAAYPRAAQATRRV